MDQAKQVRQWYKLACIANHHACFWHKADNPTALAREAVLSDMLICQQDGQGCICQDVLGCPAEYHLSQPALRVGTLD